MTLDFEFWVRAFELPALAGLLWLVLQHRAWTDRELRAVREELSAYKVHVASTYVPNDHLRVMEERLLDRLAAIERKLDRMIERRLAEAETI